MALLFLHEDEVRQTVTTAEAIDAVKAAFIAIVEGQLDIPGVFTLNIPEVKGNVLVKGTYLAETPYYVIKTTNDFADNPSFNLPSQTGLITVFDAATGFPAALMLDNGYLTTLRAGAAGALAAQHLANDKLSQVAIIGSGNQAYIQIKSLKTVREFERVVVWGRTPNEVDQYARRIVEDHDLDVEIAPSAEIAVRDADLIITATSSQEPLLKAEWLKPGVHITAIGSNHPTKQELDVSILQRADVIVVDAYQQCANAGEIHHGLESGVITAANIQGELGELMAGKIPGRTDTTQITVADLTGLDVQDAAIATLALEKALFLGLGQRLANPIMEFQGGLFG